MIRPNHITFFQAKSNDAMTVFLIRRFMQSGVVLLAMSLLVFVGVYAIGDPISLLINPRATQAEIDIAIHSLGLDRPLWEQYIVFLKGAFRGDLGYSFIHNVPALKLILQRLPATMELVSVAMLMAVAVYASIRYGGAFVLGKLSVHRGMFHSLPALVMKI